MKIVASLLFLTISLFVLNTSEAQSCDTSLDLGPNGSGQFSSPDYPDPYPTGQVCEYTITAPPGSTLSLSCTIDIRYRCRRRRGCFCVHFFNVTELNDAFCGRFVYEREIELDQFTFIFNTERGLNTNFKGFQCNVTASTPNPPTTDPATTDPATTDPATTDPATTDPATTDPATTDPATTNPPLCECQQTFTNRIVNGDDASEEEYPFMTFLFQGGGICGSSIISPRCILTAAHCIDGGNRSTIYYGEYLNPLRGATGVDRIPGTNVPHPGWTGRLGANDIGLVILDAPIPFDSTASPICLPNEPTPNNEAVTAIGWGTDETGNAPTNVLQEMPATMNNIANCNRGTDIVCIDATGRSACFGDSGGPTFSDNSQGDLTQWGLTSFGRTDGSVSGCSITVPNGYTDVYTHVDWIQSTCPDVICIPA